MVAQAVTPSFGICCWKEENSRSRSVECREVHFWFSFQDYLHKEWSFKQIDTLFVGNKGLIAQSFAWHLVCSRWEKERWSGSSRNTSTEVCARTIPAALLALQRAAFPLSAARPAVEEEEEQESAESSRHPGEGEEGARKDSSPSAASDWQIASRGSHQWEGQAADGTLLLGRVRGGGVKAGWGGSSRHAFLSSGGGDPLGVGNMLRDKRKGWALGVGWSQ